MDKQKYIQFPLMMLRKVHKDFGAGTQDIIAWSLVDFALKQKVSEEDACRQLLYDFYKHSDVIPGNIYETIENTIDIDEDYSGFRGKNYKFDPDMEIAVLLPEFSKNDELREFVIRNCQLQKIDDFLSVSGPDSLTRYNKYLKIQADIDKHEKKFGKDPYAAIELQLFWDLKEEADPILFAAYAAIKSLQGKFSYTLTNKPTIIGRMVGAKKKAILDTFKDMQPVYEKYSTRYHFDKLMTRLIRRGLVKGRITEKHWSKFALSTRLDFLQLAEVYGEKLAKNNIKAKEKAARERVRKIVSTASIMEQV